MKRIILGSEGDYYLYLAPDDVAYNLKWHCHNYLKWLEKNNDSCELQFDETDFVAYMNEYNTDKDKIKLIMHIGFVNSNADFPEEFRNYPKYIF